MRLWRISAFGGLTGIGGTFADGRWHAKPRQVLYAAEHPALALTEVLAHMSLDASSMPLTLRLFEIAVARGARSGRLPRLPDGWQANQATTRTLGSAWLDRRATLLLKVPSAIVPHSSNYLVNPLHPSAQRLLREVDHGPIWIDPRLVR